MAPQVFFFHGLESAPHGRKFHALAEHFDVESPDFQGMHIDERLEKALALTEGMSDLVVVGSSYGGLLAALLYLEVPERFFGYVLAAPALMLADELSAMPEHAAVIHGVHDEIVAIGPVRAICAEHGVDFIEVDDEHRLAESLDVLVEQTRRILEARDAR